MNAGLLDIEKVSIAGFPADSVVHSRQLTGGGNNRVFELKLADGTTRILKQYFSDESDTRNRLQTEFEAFQFLWANGVRKIPEPLGCDEKLGCALYKFVESVPFDRSKLTVQDIAQLVDFVRDLRAVSRLPEARRLGAASEASFSLVELFASIDRRFAILRDSEAGQRLGSDLRTFLDDRLLPFYASVRNALGNEARTPPLTADEQTLSPSDLGFHNALRRNDGTWIFQDFEYFGWDDPAKLIIDVELHPGMTLSGELCREWRKNVLVVFDDSPAISQRVEMLHPLYGVKWCIILLNEFVPHFRARRGFAALEPQELFETQLRQLTKARSLLDTLRGVQ